MNLKTKMSQPTFGVIGGGSWATAIVKMLSENQSKIGWYLRNQQTIDHIKTELHNPNYLSSVEFKPEQLFLSNDINDIVAYADILIFAVPSAFVNGELEKLKGSLQDKIIFSAIKGIIPDSGKFCLLYTSPSPRDATLSRMPSSA